MNNRQNLSAFQNRLWVQPSKDLEPIRIHDKINDLHSTELLKPQAVWVIRPPELSTLKRTPSVLRSKPDEKDHLWVKGDSKLQREVSAAKKIWSSKWYLDPHAMERTIEREEIIMEYFDKSKLY